MILNKNYFCQFQSHGVVFELVLRIHFIFMWIRIPFRHEIFKITTWIPDPSPRIQLVKMCCSFSLPNTKELSFCHKHSIIPISLQSIVSYSLKMQRYRDQKIWVCGKESIFFNHILLLLFFWQKKNMWLEIKIFTHFD